MAYTKKHEARTRQRLLAEAAKAFREHRMRGVSVPRNKERAGPTRGGFYGHVASKERLLAEARPCGSRVTSACRRDPIDTFAS